MFSFGGLASGLDTNSIVDSLVAFERRPIDLLRRRQAAFQTQISNLGTLRSAMSGLESAAEALSENGPVANKVTTTHDDFSITTDSDAVAGSYNVAVQQLARAAKQRTAIGMANADAEVTAGTLTITSEGTNYDITIGAGDSIGDVRDAINASNAPVSAVLLSDGTDVYLSVTAKDSGHRLGQPASDALTITETYTGGSGSTLGFASVQTAQNARVEVDGLKVDSRSNVTSTAIPGATLTLTDATNTVEALNIENDVDGTVAKLNEFANAYNSVLGFIRDNATVPEGQSREGRLGADATMVTLQRRLQRLMTTTVTGSGSLRSLVDLGFKSDKTTGNLSVDSAKVKEALDQNPGAVNALFTTDSTGIGDVVGDLVDVYTDSLDGIIKTRTDSLQNSISDMDDRIANMELRVELYTKNIQRQFTAMESAIANINSVGQFLSAQVGQQNNNNNR